MTPGNAPFLPLAKLVKFHPRKTEVEIPADLLPRLDMSNLRQTLKFDLNHTFKSKVTVTPDPRLQRLWVQMVVSPEASDWPEPTRSLRTLYCAALCAASDFVDMAEAEKEINAKELCRTGYSEEDEDEEYPHYASHQVFGPLNRRASLGYNLPLLANGTELLDRLRRRLDAIYDELPKVIEVLTVGPIPGTTPQWLKEPE